MCNEPAIREPSALVPCDVTSASNMVIFKCRPSLTVRSLVSFDKVCRMETTSWFSRPDCCRHDPTSWFLLLLYLYWSTLNSLLFNAIEPNSHLSKVAECAKAVFLQIPSLCCTDNNGITSRSSFSSCSPDRIVLITIRLCLVDSSSSCWLLFRASSEFVTYVVSWSWWYSTPIPQFLAL